MLTLLENKEEEGNTNALKDLVKLTKKTFDTTPSSSRRMVTRSQRIKSNNARAKGAKEDACLEDIHP